MTGGARRDHLSASTPAPGRSCPGLGPAETASQNLPASYVLPVKKQSFLWSTLCLCLCAVVDEHAFVIWKHKDLVCVKWVENLEPGITPSCASGKGQALQGTFLKGR